MSAFFSNNVTCLWCWCICFMKLFYLGHYVGEGALNGFLHTGMKKDPGADPPVESNQKGLH
jgi:hypothetical protein